MKIDNIKNFEKIYHISVNVLGLRDAGDNVVPSCILENSDEQAQIIDVHPHK